MNKKIADIKIGKRFRLHADVESLKQSIAENGLFHGIVISPDNELLAGYRRLIACRELGHKTILCNVIDVDSAKCELASNKEQKSFTPSEIYAVCKYVQSNTCRGRPKSGQSSKYRGPVEKNVESLTGISCRQISKIKSVMAASESDETLKQVAQELDDGKINVDSAYKTVRTKQQYTAELAQMDDTRQTRKDVTLYNGDFRDMNIPNESVHLIFTDPPYRDCDLDNYTDLAKHAESILVPGGSLFCIVPNAHIHELIPVLTQHGLTYHWTCAIQHSSWGTNVMWGKHISVRYKPLVWCVKGTRRTRQNVSDMVKSSKPAKSLHPWEQSTVESDYYISTVTIPGETIHDPFMGSGTFGVSAVSNKRKFIGAEIEQKYYDYAVRRINAIS